MGLKWDHFKKMLVALVPEGIKFCKLLCFEYSVGAEEAVKRTKSNGQKEVRINFVGLCYYGEF